MKQNVLEKHYKKFCILIETVIFFKNIVYFYKYIRNLAENQPLCRELLTITYKVCMMRARDM